MQQARRWLLPLLVLFVIATWSPQAAAQQGSFGVRAGATLDPDQFHFGVHWRPYPLTPSVRFRPSLEIGFGDSSTIGALNVDLVYELYEGEIRPFVGAGPGLSLVERERPRPREEDSFRAGLNLVAGLEWGPGYRYLVEGRVGAGDLPNMKFTFGVTF